MPRLNLPKKRKIEVNASLWKRIIAFIVDCFIILIVAYPLFNVMMDYIPVPSLETDIISSVNYMNSFLLTNPEIKNRINTVNLFILVIAFLYFLVMEFKLQQTPGKMLLKLDIRSIVKKQNKLGFWQCFVRNLFILFNFIFLIDIVYYVIKGQRLSDVLAKTKVVEVISA
ncbi:RDD family protein [Candidatus Woesearchaeota archaeon]|nr:RDD family protein [Candidatus Woesearchaeota archaeon]